MKLLIISAAFPPHRSGEATNTFFLGEALAKRGIDVHVLTGSNVVGPEPNGVTVHRIMRDWSWAELPRLLRFVKGCAPNAVLLVYIGWIYHHQFMVTFLPTFVRRSLPGVPFVTRFENTEGVDPRQTRWLARAIRKVVAVVDRRGNIDYVFGTLLRDSDRLIVLSESQRAKLSERLPGSELKTEVIAPPANMRIAEDRGQVSRRLGRLKMGIGEAEFVIAYLGYMYPGKGLETLLHAFQRVSQGRSSLRLVMIGGVVEPAAGIPERYLEKLVELSHDLGIADRIKWMGQYTWDSEDASHYLRSADLGVLPFRGGVYLNRSSLASMAAHGLPIISTRGDYLEKAFVDGENIFLVRPESVEALTAGMATVVEDVELQRRLRAGSLRLAGEWFSWEVAIERTVHTFAGASVDWGRATGQGCWTPAADEGPGAMKDGTGDEAQSATR